MQPNLLLLPCRECTHCQHIPHLLHGRENDIPCHKPTYPLPARRTRQTALIAPEVGEVARGGQDEIHIHLNIRHRFRVPVRHQWRQLREERVRRAAWVEPDCQHGRLETLGVDVHHVQLGLAAIAAHGVVGWGVDVPAFQVGGLVVPFEDWERGPVVCRV